MSATLGRRAYATYGPATALWTVGLIARSVDNSRAPSGVAAQKRTAAKLLGAWRRSTCDVRSSQRIRSRETVRMRSKRWQFDMC